MTNRGKAETIAIWLIVGLFVVQGAITSIVTPPFEASDEKWHYPMVKYIADNGSLPVQQPGVETAYRQEGSQPPLYYVLGAAITFWIDTSDMDQARHLNPHADAGATPDGNINLVVHRPTQEAFPWRGTVLAIHLIRFLSVLMSGAAVYLTYRIAREVFPHHPVMALAAAAIHAFTPMFVFISGSVNNDNLVIPLSSLALLMLIRLAQEKLPPGRGSAPEARDDGLPARLRSRIQRAGPPISRYLLLGTVLGLAALAKSSALPLTILTALVVTVRAIKKRSWIEFLAGGAGTLVPFLLVSGWWFVRNWQLYGDLTGLDTFIQILGQRDVPADLPQLWRERFSFLAGYWGNFGGLNVPMADWTYHVLNALLIVAGLGLVMLVLTHAYGQRRRRTSIAWVPLGLCLLWGLGVVAPWALMWARITWSSQGRLVFSAISVWSLLLALGIGGWLPRYLGQWVAMGFAAFLFVLSAAAPWVWIQPAYALPEPLTDEDIAAIPNRVEVDFDGVMRLLGYDLETEEVRPGETVTVTLYWEALGPADEDYTVFVHLLGDWELLVAQRDTLPGLGTLSTTWLEPGYRWADRYVVPVPATAYTPDKLQVEVGLYNRLSGARLPIAGSGDNVRFGQVALLPRQGEMPNPAAINFGDQMTLLGYDLDTRAVEAGDVVQLSLYWQGQQEMDVNYTISAQLIDSAQRKAAQMDSWPRDGTLPTSIWRSGVPIVETRSLAISPQAVPGGYDLRIAVYSHDEEGLVHLPIISQKGEMLASHVILTRVRVTP